jgi:hypothetical protein
MQAGIQPGRATGVLLRFMRMQPLDNLLTNSAAAIACAQDHYASVLAADVSSPSMDWAQSASSINACPAYTISPFDLVNPAL